MPDRLGLAADDPRRAMLAVTNPLSQEHSHLRTLLLPSLLDALARNAAWGRDDLALFEIAHIYHPRRGREAAARAVDVQRGHARAPRRRRLAARG